MEPTRTDSTEAPKLLLAVDQVGFFEDVLATPGGTYDGGVALSTAEDISSSIDGLLDKL